MLQEFVQQVEELARDVVNEIHTALPGRIIDFDPVKGLATVIPIGKYKSPSGKMLEYPSITGVPIILPQCISLQIQIAFPIKKGESCLLIISEQELDAWLYGGNSDTNLRFDLTSAIAIPGLSNQGSAMLNEACQKESLILSNADTKIQIEKDKVEVVAKSNQFSIDEQGIYMKGNVTIDGNIDCSGRIKGEM